MNVNDAKQAAEQPEKKVGSKVGMKVESQLSANQQEVIPMYYYKLVN